MGNSILYGNSGMDYLDMYIKTYASQSALELDVPKYNNTIGLVTSTSITNTYVSYSDPTNLAVIARWISGTYITVNGVQADSSSFSSTDYIPIPNGSTYVQIYGISNAGDVGYGVYDSNKNRLSWGSNPADTATTLSIPVPSGGKYFRTCCQTMYTSNAVLTSIIPANSIWIQNSTSSVVPMNISKKKGKYLYIYPKAVYQYISNTWTKLTAESYLNGAWEKLVLLIVGSDAQVTGVTTQSNWTLTGGDTSYSQSITTTALLHSGGSQQGSRTRCNVPLPTGYSKLTYTIYCGGYLSGANSWFQVGTSVGATDILSRSYTSTTPITETITINPSTNYYLTLSAYTTYTPNISLTCNYLLLS